MTISTSAFSPEMSAIALDLGAKPNGISVSSTQADFGALLNQALNNVNGLQQHSNALSTGFELGDQSISLSDTMIAKEKASVAFEATIQVRNKLVDAYKDIMNMPV
ncbi:MAG: flagellar hook-basal body complex protein FliE [Ferrimonas sp.]